MEKTAKEKPVNNPFDTMEWGDAKDAPLQSAALHESVAHAGDMQMSESYLRDLERQHAQTQGRELPKAQPQSPTPEAQLPEEVCIGCGRETDFCQIGQHFLCFDCFKQLRPARTEADNYIDFALMIRRLAARIQKYEPNSEMAKQALSLLEKKGIKSWPLR